MASVQQIAVVLDTNVVVSGLRSPAGASAALLDRALNRAFTLLLSVALALEYEAAAKDAEQRNASGLCEAEVAPFSIRFASLLSRFIVGSCGARSCVIQPMRWCLKPPSTVSPMAW